MANRNFFWRGSWCLGAVAGVVIPIGIALAGDPKVPPAG